MLFNIALLCLALLAAVEARNYETKKYEVEHFNHSLVFEIFGLDVPPILTTRPQYKGLNKLYSFAGTPDLTLTTDTWTCFPGRATNLRGQEIGHAEMCLLAALVLPPTESLFVVKLVIEDVGTLVIASHLEGLVSEIAPDIANTASVWAQFATLLPSTEGSFLSYLNKGQFKQWRGYCYIDADVHLTVGAAGPVLFDFPRVFCDCSYRKPEKQRRVSRDY
eukprot:TRINITY_DN25094_c0_g1_i1.p1 TRINITY_DN25094_c0_g1~~TRINITY_DN25094_c0_g1_i1.p1  ORF type:complete len:220 (-),score=0.20 TRINITY_DN25094_c0_g1_i1:41-700(-)